MSWPRDWYSRMGWPIRKQWVHPTCGSTSHDIMSDGRWVYALDIVGCGGDRWLIDVMIKKKKIYLQKRLWVLKALTYAKIPQHFDISSTPHHIDYSMRESISHLPPSFHLHRFLINSLQQCLPCTSSLTLITDSMTICWHPITILWLIVNMLDEASVSEPQPPSTAFPDPIKVFYASGLKRKISRPGLILRNETGIAGFLRHQTRLLTDQKRRRG